MELEVFFLRFEVNGIGRNPQTRTVEGSCPHLNTGLNVPLWGKPQLRHLEDGDRDTTVMIEDNNAYKMINTAP